MSLFAKISQQWVIVSVFCYVVIVYSQKNSTENLEKYNPNEIPWETKTKLGDSCGGTIICERTLFLKCLQLGAKLECMCNPSNSIQIDFLGRRIGRMCALKGGVPCKQGRNDEPVFFNTTTYVKDIKTLAKDVLERLSNTSDNFPSKQEKVFAELRIHYTAEFQKIIPWKKFVEDYVSNYTKDVQQYSSGKYIYAILCASGECDRSGLCTREINIRHILSGQQRKFSENKGTKRYLLNSFFISILLLEIFFNFFHSKFKLNSS